MKLPKLTIELPDTDEIRVVTVTPRTEVLWERHFGEPYMSMWIPLSVKLDVTDLDNLTRDDLIAAAQAISPDHLYFAAYAADTKCQGIEYDDWLDTIASVAIGAEDPEADAVPLDSGVSTGSPAQDA